MSNINTEEWSSQEQVLYKILENRNGIQKLNLFTNFYFNIMMNLQSLFTV